LEEFHKSPSVPNAEKLLYVPGIKAVHPLGKEPRIFFGGEERLREPSVKQTPVEIADIKIREE
jgi:hypothetical protein